MKVKVKEIATVQMGYSFRSRLEASKSGDVSVIQMKDLLDSNTVDCSRLTKIDIEAIKDNHLALRGDLIFRSRGQVATSAILLENPEKTIISAPLLRIRITALDKILPEYLNWYIAQRDAQIFFTSRAKGTAQRMIGKQEIGDLDISLPSNLEKQKDIVELALLSAREQNISGRLSEKREQYISTLLMQLAKGE